MKKKFLYIIGMLVVFSAIVYLPQLAVSDDKKASEDEPLPRVEQNAPLEVDIWGGIRDLYSIAVPMPIGNSEMSKSVKEIQENDFMLSSLFKVLESKSFIADLTAEGMTIEKDPWVQVGAQGVVKCKTSVSSDNVTLDCVLFEVASGTSPVLSKSYNGAKSEIRSLVHKWVNDVIKYFTGEPGAFGTSLVFSRKTGPNVKHVFTADWTGGGVSKITRNNSINILPAFGPGGSVYYTSFVEGSPYLYRTGQRNAVLSNPGLNMGAVFHGNKMAVVLSKDGNPEIYVGNADGSGLTRVTNSPSIDVSPSFSPDGSQIAFVSDRHGSPQIFVMSAGGGGAKRITFQGSYNQTPSWCQRPGSNLIAFTGRDGGAYDIFTVDAGTKKIRRLTQKQGQNMDPAFSPDCRQVAFSSSRGGIFVSNPDGLNQKKVLNGMADTIKWSN
ncbi:MAG: PD40 domain-containing protein [Deltaproteobacteria bacterium]|nr:PD40 domain-containing protein [Deltaproteobacteria bacterium]